MDSTLKYSVETAKQDALEVLLHNARNGRAGLPRTAGWGYHEPYTRDLMISTLGILASGNEELADSLRRTLISLAANQSPLGLIPGLVDEPSDLGSSDTTPLFLIGLGAYRKVVGQPDFLEEAASKAICWMAYQSPSDRVLVAHQPTSDWRDEQWVLGFGLYVNTLVHTFLRLHGHSERAERLRAEMNKPVLGGDWIPPRTTEGLVLEKKPYYALWSYKLYCSERFDLLGNSLAILSGVATREKAESIIEWISGTCQIMRKQGVLSVALPPSLLPFIEPQDLDWRNRYRKFNNPGEYHNGGIWPFVCGFYIAALVALGRKRLAARKLAVLAELNRRSKDSKLEFGFNEWIRAQDGLACGEDWQTWSAAMYLYAAACVETGATPLFDEVRGSVW